MDHKSRWLAIADRLKPKLHTETVYPLTTLPSAPLRKGDSITVDFGNHFVGHVTLQLSCTGSHQDAPALIRIKFCEAERELIEDSQTYNGWISRGWIQEEQLHIDVLPHTLSLSRRYAFRYVKIEVIDVSSKFSLVVDSMTAVCTTAADGGKPAPFNGSGAQKNIDRIALRTLRNCMQDVFEDGPKRDRRLWMGDLYLQAKTNYDTFRNNNLAKRCLYLFAGTARDDDKIAACVFTEPDYQADDTYLLDYSLLFIPTLLEYYQATGDRDTMLDLAPIALKQLEICQSNFDANHIIRDCDEIAWCFVDWNLQLNKQAAAQAIYVFCAKAGQQLAVQAGLQDTAVAIGEDWKLKSAAALQTFFDAQRNIVCSGDQRQVSIASQVWFILSGIVSVQQGQAMLRNAEEDADCLGIVTPYLYHFYVQALLKLAMPAQARQVLMDYWGAMAAQGADTFYELFNPDNPHESPYGSSIVNSYCHAWSCTPAWYFRNPQFLEEDA